MKYTIVWAGKDGFPITWEHVALPAKPDESFLLRLGYTQWDIDNGECELITVIDEEEGTASEGL